MGDGDCIVTPGAPLRGEIDVPGDKSISHRSLILSAIASGPSVIRQLSFGEDVLSTLNALQHLGVNYTGDQHELKVIGQGLHGLSPSSTALNLTTRHFNAIIVWVIIGSKFFIAIDWRRFAHQKTDGQNCRTIKEMGAEIKLSRSANCAFVCARRTKTHWKGASVTYRQRASQIGIIIGESLCQRTDYDC